MNNKGQALITFILVLPIILVIMSLVIDYGILSIDKRSTTNTIKTTIEYGLKHENDLNVITDMEELMYKNIDRNNVKDLDITNNDHKIIITLDYNPKRLFNILNVDSIVISYEGEMTGNNIRITKR